jgi:hypothetical protein
MRSENQETVAVSRRKVVKTIVGGVTAVAAYNMLPAKWGKPIIESVFLPAHATTSGSPQAVAETVSATVGACTVSITKGDRSASTTVHFLVEGMVTPAVNGLPVNISVNTIGGADAGASTYSASLLNLTTDVNGQFSQEFGGWAADTERVEVTITVDGAEGSSFCAADVPPAP